MNARHLVAEPGLCEPVNALGVRTLAAQRAHVEHRTSERGNQRRIVDLRIVRERHHGARRVELDLCKGLIRPGIDQGDSREAIRAREGAPRIDYDHLETRQCRHRREKLADMRGPDHDQARRPRVRANEKILRPGKHAATVGDEHALRASPLLIRQLETSVPALAVKQALRAVPEPGHRCDRAPRRGRGSQAFVQHSLHSSRSRKTRTFPPQASPTSQACSSDTPNSSMRTLPSAMAASASVTTAPSMQPPETEPTNSPRSFTARWLPSGRGEEPQVCTTVARATPCPLERQRSMWGKISSESVGMASLRNICKST